MRLVPTPSRNENPARTGVKGSDMGGGVGVLRTPLALVDEGAGRLLSERSFFVVDAMVMNKFRDEPKPFDSSLTDLREIAVRPSHCKTRTVRMNQRRLLSD